MEVFDAQSISRCIQDHSHEMNAIFSGADKNDSVAEDI